MTSSVDDRYARELAGAELERRLTAVRAADLHLPSSCTGWSVHDLVNHVNGGGHRYLLLMRGARADELAGTRTQDHVGSDPLGGYRRWQQPLARAFSERGALDRVVHHPAGDRSGSDLLRMRILDVTVHAWDLARSLGLDETLDHDLAGHLLTTCTYLVDELRDLGLYAAPGRRSGDALSVQHELLWHTGRA
jgi:uncharacterized protein (TIGR03086 family)